MESLNWRGNGVGSAEKSFSVSWLKGERGKGNEGYRGRDYDGDRM